MRVDPASCLVREALGCTVWGMGDERGFDPTFDFRTEAGIAGDPDSTSPTLRAYHKLLWSKPLPSGDPFDSDDTESGYLHHLSARGEFYLTSDSVIQTWTRWQRMRKMTEQVPESEREQFLTTAHQIGDEMLFRETTASTCASGVAANAVANRSRGTGAAPGAACPCPPPLHTRTSSVSLGRALVS